MGADNEGTEDEEEVEDRDALAEDTEDRVMTPPERMAARDAEKTKKSSGTGWFGN